MKRVDRLFVVAVCCALGLHWVITMRVSRLERRLDHLRAQVRQLEDEADG